MDPCYLSLVATGEERKKRYEAWVNDAIPAGEWKMIRQAIQRGQLTGSEKFFEEIGGN